MADMARGVSPVPRRARLGLGSGRAADYRGPGPPGRQLPGPEPAGRVRPSTSARVPWHGQRWVGVVIPASLRLRSVVAYSIAARWPTRSPSAAPSTSGSGRASTACARQTARIAAGTLDGKRWSFTGYAGPWGICLWTTGGRAASAWGVRLAAQAGPFDQLDGLRRPAREPDLERAGRAGRQVPEVPARRTAARSESWRCRWRATGTSPLPSARHQQPDGLDRVRGLGPGARLRVTVSAKLLGRRRLSPAGPAVIHGRARCGAGCWCYLGRKQRPAWPLAPPHMVLV